MPDDFEETLAREVPRWVEDGLVSQEQGERILDRYETEPAPEGGEAGLASALAQGGFESALYGTAAVLAGAGVLAFVLVGLDPPDPGGLLAGLGLAMAGLGAVLHTLDSEAGRVADALLAAALVPLAAAALPISDPGWAAGVPGLLVPAALLVWRRRRPWVRHLSVVAFSVAAGGTAVSQFEANEAGAWFWAGLQSLLLAGLVAGDRLAWGEDHDLATGLAVAGFAVASGLFLEVVVDVGGSEQLELALGGTMLAVLVAGLALAHRGLVGGAGVVLAGDAVVFAFDVGGTFGGALLLLGLAAVLVWQAETLRRAVG